MGLCLTTTVWAQTCNDQMLASTPTNIFIINTDNTVTDTQTGLIWKHCLEGVTGTQCEQGTATSFTWQQALEYAAKQPEWRLPNIRELTSIVELKCSEPAINLSVFPATPSNSIVWSSSPHANNSNNAWFVYFSNGSDQDYNRSSNTYVNTLVNTSDNIHLRLVRN